MPKGTRSGKYEIKKITNFLALVDDPPKSLFGWWLARPDDAQILIFPTWKAAIQAMDLDAARQVARSNRVPLGPIRKSEGK